MPELDELLQMLVERHGSDLHLHAGEPPIIRFHGSLWRTELPPLTAEDTARLISTFLSDERRIRFADQHELEISFSHSLGRFRASIFRQRGQAGAVLRLIPLTVPAADELMLPSVTLELALRPKGLLLATGPTRSGKSTTIAALVDHINTHRPVHVITVEDPIEFLHTDKLASVEQRELGQDASSMQMALAQSLRHNPDVLVVGEIDTCKTMEIALEAAEAGCLVLGMAHTNDAVHTVERLVDLFPGEQHRQICSRLASTLLGVISQTLLPRMDVIGRVAAFEVMVAVPQIRALIRDSKLEQITNEIQTGSQFGMETLDHSLATLVRRRLVRFDDAIAQAANPRDFEQRVGPIKPLRL